MSPLSADIHFDPKIYVVGNVVGDRRPPNIAFKINLLQKEKAPQVGLEPTTLRLTAGCSAIELLRSKGRTEARWRLSDPRSVAKAEIQVNEGFGRVPAAGALYNRSAMKYFVRTYGCQMNVADSSEMGRHLQARGITSTDNPDEASIPREYLYCPTPRRRARLFRSWKAAKVESWTAWKKSCRDRMRGGAD